MHDSLKGSTTLVTGASRGIGRAIALEMARAGANVIVATRRAETLDGVVQAITAAGGSACAVTCDVTSDADVVRMRDECCMVFRAPDVLVNCAGSHIVAPFLDATINQFHDMIEINYLSTVRVIQAFLPAMVARGAGRIINISSTAGIRASRNQSMYNGSKHAVVGLTRCLGVELASLGISVNAICPGFVDTELLQSAVEPFARAAETDSDTVVAQMLARVPTGKLLSPEEIAAAALYLASPGSRSMTGQVLILDGGLSA